MYDETGAFVNYLNGEEESKVSFSALLQEGEHELVPTHLTKLLHQLTELSEERFLEAFLESGPQSVLQFYITIVCKNDFNKWQQLSVISSLSSLALTISDYTGMGREVVVLTFLILAFDLQISSFSRLWSTDKCENQQIFSF